MKNIAYIDGSFNPKTLDYGAGGILFDQYGIMRSFSVTGESEKAAKMRNVAGEILASKTVIQMAIDLGMKSLHVYHDYEGISNWVNGKWKVKNPVTKQYKKFVKNKNRSGISIVFEHIKSHSGNKYNDMADKLARKAVGL